MFSTIPTTLGVDHTCVMWFHALQSMDENASAIEVDFAGLGQHAALDLAPWPEPMPH
jgi:hypothetical protein